MVDTRYLFLLIRFKLLLLSFFQQPPFGAKADAKIRPISKLTKYFFKKFFHYSAKCCQSTLILAKKFYHNPSSTLQKRIQSAQKSAKFEFSEPSDSANSVYNHTEQLYINHLHTNKHVYSMHPAGTHAEMMQRGCMVDA